MRRPMHIASSSGPGVFTLLHRHPPLSGHEEAAAAARRTAGVARMFIVHACSFALACPASTDWMSRGLTLLARH